jgi:hypothetical protein
MFLFLVGISLNLPSFLVNPINALLDKAKMRFFWKSVVALLWRREE